MIFMIKKIIYVLLFILISAGLAFAQTKDAYLQYSSYKYEFRPGDEVKFLNNANNNMLLFEKSKTQLDKLFYLQEAMRYYFLLSQINPGSIDAQIGLGRVYDEMKLDKLAKKHFFNALNFNSHNPLANLYFANFYYKRNDLIQALYYYKNAYKSNYSNNYYLNCMLGTVYEKLADIESAKKFYVTAAKINPQNNNELKSKILLLDGINYSQSRYTKRQK